MAESSLSPELYAKLRRAVELDATQTMDDVVEQLRAGEAQLWVRGDSIVVTQVLTSSQRTTLHFWLAAGNLEEVLAMGDGIYEWGRAVGCTTATMLGRKGWAGPLADQGWHPSKLVEYRKEL